MKKNEIEVYLLGAGRPAQGYKPTALKSIALNTRAMDWQLHSFESVTSVENITFLGGYGIDKVIEKYTFLKYQVIPNWQQGSVLHTFLSAQFTGRELLASYSDTVFHQESITELLKLDADIVFAIDTCWKNRFESRSETDIKIAETMIVDEQQVEFTGLIYFSAAVVKVLSTLSSAEVGRSFIDLINYLSKQGYTVASYDVTGHWAEFNSFQDIAHFMLGTKSETLARLAPLLKHSTIGTQVSFTSLAWQQDYQKILRKIKARFTDCRLVIRSSSIDEDNWYSSNAGGFTSILDVDGNDENKVSKAVDDVITSFGQKQTGEDQILVQELLSEVQAAGVVFTCDLESGAPYYRFNFDDKTQSTESVTAGTHSDLRTVLLNRSSPEKIINIAPELEPVLVAIQELEQLLGFDKLDIEFAIAKTGQVHIFQVRPITINHDDIGVDEELVAAQLNNAALQFIKQQKPSPFVYGNKTILANMPDWNPAEIIGTRPKPLAFSLYRHLITNDIWAQQRAEFGYRDVNPAPLLVALCGQPYIDCRASINSFIPAAVSEATAQRLANAYLAILADNPNFHDKIEFDVLFTTWTPDFNKKAQIRLLSYGVSQQDINSLGVALKKITYQALTRLTDDTASIALLNKRRELIETSELTVIDKIYSLLEDCKRFGTLAFSHAARANFVAMSLLKGFVDSGLLTDLRREQFLKSFTTVAGNFSRDKSSYAKGKFSLQELISKYGHLRPGTYDVTTQAYWEDPARYLNSVNDSICHQLQAFEFSDDEISSFTKVLAELGPNLSAQQLVNYLVESTQAREFVKFEFTRNLSRALDYCLHFGHEEGLSRDELAFLTFNDIKQVKLNVIGLADIKSLIKMRKQSHSITCAIELPSFIQKDIDIFCFERFASQPNFVTASRVEGHTQRLNKHQNIKLKDKIVLIPQADPGFDWLFSHGIAGLITQYGGANSHMAIRAAEIGLPAAIGVGEKLYEEIAVMQQVELDCGNQIIRCIV
ncbi:PEP-utilizing enzyme [Colwellia psychrerythraea]|uniref:Pyruvate phosphate dikinase PEP/pyruvate-binding protein n=1 Tax=Colwellia psychrerythraea TaxID=28229 RepID=A0A099KMJ7_COLPS|nr:PEP-utilizing enzyme [Colwellia psychrerythraea]KGJ90888.1 pyruvate phosphate dikinase PEP/pyruvate-binding protein [Colwellia psychrerythraea]